MVVVIWAYDCYSLFVVISGSGMYELQGFICHIGKNTDHGHYVCHLKKPNGEWVFCNDDKVNMIRGFSQSDWLCYR